jgi:hypothetical protein
VLLLVFADLEYVVDVENYILGGGGGFCYDVTEIELFENGGGKFHHDSNEDGFLVFFY